jgi:hypothetical protein
MSALAILDLDPSPSRRHLWVSDDLGRGLNRSPHQVLAVEARPNLVEGEGDEGGFQILHQCGAVDPP